MKTPISDVLFFLLMAVLPFLVLIAIIGYFTIFRIEEMLDQNLRNPLLTREAYWYIVSFAKTPLGLMIHRIIGIIWVLLLLTILIMEIIQYFSGVR